MTWTQYAMKSIVQRSIRSLHARLLKKALPLKASVLLHNLEPSSYPAFREMIGFFRETGYRLASPDAFLTGSHKKQLFVSFDDNYRAWFEALPLFEELDVQVTFYVNTCVFRGRATDAELHAYYDRLSYKGERAPLSVGELRAIDEAGHIIGAHTHSHFKLTAVPIEQAKQEIRKSKTKLEALLGHEVRHFSYPFGMRRHFNEALRAYCQTLGFVTVAQAIPAMLHAPQQPYTLNRSPWDVERPLSVNVENLCIDGRHFAHLTGRSAVG